MAYGLRPVTQGAMLRVTKGLVARLLAVATVAALVCVDVADGEQHTVDALNARAFEHTYNLDYHEALAAFDAALARNPDDSATHRGRATAIWLHIIFSRGSVTVDQYLGGMTNRDVRLEKPAPEDAAAFATHASRALQLAERRLQAHPDDVDALYDLGAAVGLQASYAATVEGRIGGAFRAARRAYDAHERVLALDPRRPEAGLIVGTYRYVVSTLAMPMRWMAYLVGFGGDKSRGLQLIEAAASADNQSQVDAKFALMLLYNRERRYDEALGVIRELMRRFPRNRVLWLEAGATAIRARQFSEAERLLTEGINRLPSDKRPRAHGEEALWFYKRGLARVSLRRLEEAKADLTQAHSLPARDWVRARIQLEFGKLADLTGKRADARSAYEIAARLAQTGNDPATRREAERLRSTPFR